jgi:hypothetical protein
MKNCLSSSLGVVGIGCIIGGLGITLGNVLPSAAAAVACGSGIGVDR